MRREDETHFILNLLFFNIYFGDEKKNQTRPINWISVKWHFVESVHLEECASGKKPNRIDFCVRLMLKSTNISRHLGTIPLRLRFEKLVIEVSRFFLHNPNTIQQQFWEILSSVRQLAFKILCEENRDSIEFQSSWNWALLQWHNYYFTLIHRYAPKCEASFCILSTHSLAEAKRDVCPKEIGWVSAL